MTTPKTIWRGGGMGSFPSASDVTSVFDTKANLIRYQLVLGNEDPRLLDRNAYFAWIESSCDHLDTLLKLGTPKQRFIIDLHSMPGGVDENNHLRMLYDFHNDFLLTFYSAWIYIAERFKDNPKVHAYDLCNECASSSVNVRLLMKNTVDAIRKKDSTKRLSVTTPYANPDYYKTLVPLGFSNLWYTFHFYKPLLFTHQGVYDNPYPIPCNVTSDQLRKWMQPVRDFQLKYGATIYVGEFSVSSMAKTIDRVKWLKMCIDIFEDYGWQWSYHAWFESDYWNPTIPDNTVKDLLTNYYSRNNI